jgi:hypothetical protein
MAFNHPACHRKMGFTYICGNCRKIGQRIAKKFDFFGMETGHGQNGSARVLAQPIAGAGEPYGRRWPAIGERKKMSQLSAA